MKNSCGLLKEVILISNRGWLKLHRQLLDSALWQASKPEQKVILITLFMLANPKEKESFWKNKKIILSPGQLIISIPQLSKVSGVSVQNVRTALKKFSKLNVISEESSTYGRLITITNWSTHQAPAKNETGVNISDVSVNDTVEKNPSLNIQYAIDEIKTLLPEKSESEIKMAIASAVVHGASNIKSYALSIIKNSENKPLYTAANPVFDMPQSHRQRIKKTRFSNFKERETIDFSEIRELERARIDKELEDFVPPTK